MISIVIPSYNPNIAEFKKSVSSALQTNTNEIIIVDDCSDKENIEYFTFLKEVDKNERVKVIYNKENKGRFLNSFFALQQSSNYYVKKLDADDEIIYQEFNKINIQNNEMDILVTRYKYKNRTKNKTSKTNKWNLFNGSVIYKTSLLKELSLTNIPKNFWGDLIFIFSILSKDNVKIKYLKNVVYKYKIIGSTTPSKLLNNWEDWLVGYNWVLSNVKNNVLTKHSIEKLNIFYELMMIKMKKEYKKNKSIKYFYYCPFFLKRIISFFVFKI